MHVQQRPLASPRVGGSRRTRRRWVVGALLGLLLPALGLWFVWELLTTRTELRRAETGTAELVSALTAQDRAAARRELTRVQQSFAAAHRHSDGPLWAVAGVLPLVGDDVTAVRAVAEVGDDLSRGALAQLVSRADGDLAERLVPHRGRIDLEAVESLEPLVAGLSTELTTAAARLDEVPTDGLTRWVAPAFTSATTRLNRADTALRTADRAVRVLPEMLGADGPKSYLVLLNNNAEIRATGGLPGAYALLRADEGRLRMVRQGTPSDIGKFDRPVLRQSPTERQIYDTHVAEYLQDTNFTPEFPRTAELVREMWRRTQGQQLDGVISVDAVSVSYLLRATGPIDVGGVRLTHANATRELLNNVYFRLDSNEAQDAFFEQVAGAVFSAVSKGAQSPRELVSAFGQSAREGRLYLHSFDEEVQAEVSGTAVAGELYAGPSDQPELGVYLNDATGSKMSYYLRREVSVSAQSCTGGRQKLSARAELSYSADSPPAAKLNEFVTGPGTYGTPKGQQMVHVRLYGPDGGELGPIEIDGVTVPTETVEDRGRPVASTVVLLERGQSVDMRWTARSGEGQDGPVTVRTSPGLEPEPATATATSACDAG